MLMNQIKFQIAQYIGEMCRYCLSTPGQQTDTSHKLRMVFGNGLRPQIWSQFVSRFNIPRVCEFCESILSKLQLNCHLMFEIVFKTVQLRATQISLTLTMLLVLLDSCLESFQRFIRYRSSRPILTVVNRSVVLTACVSCANLTSLECLSVSQHLHACVGRRFMIHVFAVSGKIIPNNPSRAFLGYVDKSASDKKIVHDVFRKGDSAFLSGDILTADECGNLFFVDRTGDTFRVRFSSEVIKTGKILIFLLFIQWKGENCSTTEIEATVSNEADYRDSVVYGVEIINVEGKFLIRCNLFLKFNDSEVCLGFK